MKDVPTLKCRVGDVRLTDDGSLVGKGTTLINEHPNNGFTPSEIPNLGKIDLSPERMENLQKPSCLF